MSLQILTVACVALCTVGLGRPSGGREEANARFEAIRHAYRSGHFAKCIALYKQDPDMFALVRLRDFGRKVAMLMVFRACLEEGKYEDAVRLGREFIKKYSAADWVAEKITRSIELLREREKAPPELVHLFYAVNCWRGQLSGSSQVDPTPAARRYLQEHPEYRTTRYGFELAALLLTLDYRRLSRRATKVTAPVEERNTIVRKVPRSVTEGMRRIVQELEALVQKWLDSDVAKAFPGRAHLKAADLIYGGACWMPWELRDSAKPIFRKAASIALEGIKAGASGPTLCELLLRAGRALNNAGDHEEAAGYLRRALSLAYECGWLKGPTASEELVDALVRSGDWNEALRVAVAAERQWPLDPMVWAGYVELAQAIKDHDIETGLWLYGRMAAFWPDPNERKGWMKEPGFPDCARALERALEDEQLYLRFTGQESSGRRPERVGGAVGARTGAGGREHVRSQNVARTVAVRVGGRAGGVLFVTSGLVLILVACRMLLRNAGSAAVRKRG